MLFGASDNDGPATTDEEIVKEAVERWRLIQEWEGVQNQRAREDTKFSHADPRNMWQWDQADVRNRTGNGRTLPCLTVNTTRVHNDMIINAMSKNDFAPKVRPVGGRASYQSAQVIETLIKRTMNISQASAAFRKCAEQQVDGGMGYIILETDWVSERSFDQEVYVASVRDPTGVGLDPWIKKPDGSDADFGFIIDFMSRKAFNRKYPKFKDKVGSAALDTYAGWLTDKEVAVAKYYRKKAKGDTLVSYKGEDGIRVEKFASEIKDEAGKELFKLLMADIDDGVIDGRHRRIENNEVEWFMIAGDTIINRDDWPGKYIPICRCPGRELTIDGTLDRKGHTRPLVDTQRILNYQASVSVQYAASAVKSQWLAPARAVEGQDGWKTANIDNFAVLFYNDVDDESSPELAKVGPPTRIEPPQVNAAAQNGMENAERQMMMISGQFQAQMGENDTQSAASGKAINERKEQGDVATYHFTEHRSDMFRYIGMQLLDLYPKIYDTERVLHIDGDAGEKYWIQIDPSQPDAIQELKYQAEDEEAVRLAFNPTMGQYECVSDPGPDYATQRQEAWNAYSLILQQNMALAATIGDLIFRYGDFPGADKIADRLEKEIKATKPYLFDANSSPQFLQLQAQGQKLQSLNQELMQKLALKEIALKGKDEKRDIEAWRAATDRLKVQLEYIKDVMLTPADKARMEHELESKFHDHSLSMIAAANQSELDIAANAASGDDDQTSAGGGSSGGNGSQPPSAPAPVIDSAPPGFSHPRVAPDGKTYVQHLGTGQYHRVDKAA